MIDQDLLKSALHYDPETGDFVWKIRAANRIHIGDIAGTKRKGYIQIKIFGVSYLLHRLAFLYMEGCFPSAEVDHINGNGLDNRWSNLRHATRSQNCMNKGVRVDSLSGIKGLSLSRLNTWCAQISIDGVAHVRRSTDKAELEEWLMAARPKIHGDFHRNE